jgi:hypothetical protein
VNSPEETPPTARERGERVAPQNERDLTPAVGKRGGPAAFRRALEGAGVALATRAWGDARWSYLYGPDTDYAAARPEAGELEGAARRMRAGAPPEDVHGPIMKPPVWGWEIPLYFWFGGIASGSAFVALGCDLAGDHRSAVTARRVALAALMPCPPLLVGDLGRPLRFAYMLRIFKPRSPMSTGSWCLATFGALGTGAVAADVVGRARVARALGAGTALAGAYLGSYTGVLLAATAVPLWSRSRLFLAPIFMATATATGAAAGRLALAAAGIGPDHPTNRALTNVETGAMLAELGLSAVNQRRLGPLAEPLRRGASGRLRRAAELGVAAGLGLSALRPRLGPTAGHASSALYLAAGLAFRYAWVMAGRASASDDRAVALIRR